MKKDASWMKEGEAARSSEFSDDAKIYVRSVIHNDVIVQTSHKLIMEAVQSQKQHLHQDGKACFMHCFHSIANAIRDADVDKIYKGMRLGREEDVQAWQNLCDDTILHVVARFILWKRMIPIQKHVDEFMKL